MKTICNCEICKASSKMNLSENDLHVYVGTHQANHRAELRDFEKKLKYHNVIHWDVGFSKAARYYIYRDALGKCIAWYDAVTNRGFKFV